MAKNEDNEDNEEPEFHIEVPIDSPVACADRLWQLHKLALAALRAAEKKSNVTIDRTEWLVVRPKNKYTVCLSGALLIVELELELDKTPEIYHPDNFAHSIRRRLEALDGLRAGDVTVASEAWDVKLPHMETRWARVGHKLRLWQTERLPERICPDYHDDKALWWVYQNKLQQILKEEDV